MSRKSRNRSPRRRVVRNNAKRSLPTYSPPQYQFDLEDYLIGDRRRFHPDQDDAPAATLDSRPHRLVVRPSHKSPPARRQLIQDNIPQHVSFDTPEKVLVCVRRTRRKEVLHALRKTGKAGQKAPRRSAFSEIHC
nr:MAG: hypothetical protein [Microvirus sp.]